MFIAIYGFVRFVNRNPNFCSIFNCFYRFYFLKSASRIPFLVTWGLMIMFELLKLKKRKEKKRSQNNKGFC